MLYFFAWIAVFSSLLLPGCASSEKEKGRDSFSFFPPAHEEKAEKQAIPYAVHFSAPGAESLLTEVTDNSQLVWLKMTPPGSRVALERRILEDVGTARKILQSNGYYNGNVSYDVQWNTKPVLIQVTLTPGPLYRIGETSVHYQTARLVQKGNEKDAVPPLSEKQWGGTDFMRDPPHTLASFGVRKGDPAKAEPILNAEATLLTTLHNEGYPKAALDKSRYIIDRALKTLDAETRVKTGPLLRMGEVRVKQESATPEGEEASSAVNDTYLNRLATWNTGQFWDEHLIKTYRTALQETGLFSSIRLEPDSSVVDTDGNTPVDLTVRDAPPRTISGGVQYSTDTGAGVRGAWENRNLWGGGEQLRLTLPISEDLQLLSASFRKPAFGRRNQALVGEAEARHETSDAYDQTAAYVAGGIERRFSGDWKHWWGSIRGSVEGGELDDNNGRQAYFLFGVPVSLRRDTTNSLFDPTEGTRLALTVTPYTGSYHGSLTTVRTRVDGSAYVTPFETSRIVLAARAAAGSLTADSVNDIPASLRFYAGGGGSVRGYKYQSLGPHDKDGNPIGGLSFTEVGAEVRFRITENFGIVPFVDGGMVYDHITPKWGKDMAWGAGLGFRYYTVIGPVRLDVATPLQDREHNKRIQVYLSIGQAF